ncbi:hypothetical protein CP965_12340 [Halarcobacter mediterraneus]|uniref:Uncharacterized protein n=1 Tax=Halarcobacter mediterraneus TaxID=2023153 RepID=A0A4Q1ATG4_9BACT|nr:hypothetical protein [Halarcobacter mediterraneus]RXK11960.1 hypothetical protein CP965_12340 [Halarcobacter mediterraneus]
MRFVTLLVITSSENEDKVKKIAKNAGAGGATVIQGRGTSSDSEKKSFFSLTYEGNQVIIVYVLEEKLSRTILKEFHMYIENKKIEALAFTLPISHLVGLDRSLLKKFENSIKTNDDL